MGNAPPNWVTIKIDAKNMFNTLHRGEILEEVDAHPLTRQFTAVSAYPMYARSGLAGVFGAPS